MTFICCIPHPMTSNIEVESNYEGTFFSHFFSHFWDA